MQPEILQILYQDYTGHTAESIIARTANIRSKR